MPCEGDWLPGGRELRLVMAKNWLAALEARAKAWKVPSTEVAELQALTGAAGAALAAVSFGTRSGTQSYTEGCKCSDRGSFNSSNERRYMAAWNGMGILNKSLSGFYGARR
ncbi:MAG: hypothetical protein LBH85_03405 [Treponema sp.]|jgi:hypothetical protein|nr:hypothetical protein [Treponema sp.]